MNTRQAIAAIRLLHKGRYHEHAEWVCQKRPGAPSTAEKAAAREQLAAARAANGGRYSLPLAPEIKALQSIAWADSRCVIGRLNTLTVAFLSVEGEGDTWADAVADARRRMGRRDAEAAEIRKGD